MRGQRQKNPQMRDPGANGTSGVMGFTGQIHCPYYPKGRNGRPPFSLANRQPKAVDQVNSNSAFSIQHSAFSIQHSAFSIQHSAFSIQDYL